MSNIYVTEPPTKGKVLLQTSYGDIDVELWPKEAPLACRNFVQLAMEGYYNNTIFHRCIKDFMIQGGDPTGTGTGGESIYGKPFADEIHQRLKFNHRGLVAMANDASQAGSNRSQFFITLGPCEWLNKKHTIFGKITGDTIFNALRMGEVDVDSDDRPHDPPVLKRIEILSNPFNDIVPRETRPDPAAAADAKLKQKKKKKGKKALNVLSFGDEAAEEEQAIEATSTAGIKSSHEVGDDSRLLAATAEPLPVRRERGKRDDDGDDDDTDGGGRRGKRRRTDSGDSDGEVGESVAVRAVRDKLRGKASAAGKVRSNGGAGGGPTGFAHSDGEAGDVKDAGGHEREREGKKSTAKKAKRAQMDEYRKLRDELREARKATAVATGADAAASAAAEATSKMMTPLEQMRAKFKKRKERHGDREKATLARLGMFKSTLRDAQNKTGAGSKDDAGDEAGQDTTGYAGEVTERGDDDEDDEGWMTTKLKFTRHIDDALRSGGDDLVTIDEAAGDHRSAHRSRKDAARQGRRRERW